MSNNKDFIFKIGIVGPTRVGKTSLITSILKDGEKLLEGTQISIKSFDTKTARRIAQHNKDLAGSIYAGEFNAGAVAGTEETFTYELILDPGVESSGIRLSLQDYPGGWIDPNHRPPNRETDWNNCQQWIEESAVLIVPIESAVMMEAATSDQRKAVPAILETHSAVLDVTRLWAKSRKAKNSTEPALLMFVPVKCESYFADNGGKEDKSVELIQRFQTLYKSVLDAVKNEAEHIEILYAPVDTIGCVQIIDSNWKKHPENPKELIFSANYRVREPKYQNVKGARTLLISMFRLLINEKKSSESLKSEQLNKESSDKDDAARSAREYAERKEGLLKTLLMFFTNEREKRREIANKTEHLASEVKTKSEHQRHIVESLTEVIERLATYNLGERARKL